jgi:hypothetical protein
MARQSILVPWQYAGKEVWVRDHGRHVEVRYGAERIAMHVLTVRHHQVIAFNDHHAGIPLGNKQNGKTLIHIEQSAPGHMKVWPWEAADEFAGASADHAGRAQSDRHRCGACQQE